MIISQWTSAGETERGIAWARDTFSALTPYLAPTRYLNYLEERCRRSRRRRLRAEPPPAARAQDQVGSGQLLPAEREHSADVWSGALATHPIGMPGGDRVGFWLRGSRDCPMMSWTTSRACSTPSPAVHHSARPDPELPVPRGDHTADRSLHPGRRLFPYPTPAYLDGSSIGGRLKVGWIGVGLLMEFRSGDRYVITSPVRAITTEQASSSVVH